MSRIKDLFLFEPCSIQQILVELESCKAKLPVTVLTGREKGKTILLTSGVHGCEYSAIQALIELSSEIDVTKVEGRIIMIHPVAISSFIEKRPFVLPEDGINLNASFPGNKNGSFTERLAYDLEECFFKITDYFVDCHSGDLHEELYPYVYYPTKCAENIMTSSKKLTDHLNVSYRVASTAVSGAYNYAASIGIPSILIERGGLGVWCKEWVEEYKSDLLSLLSYLKVYESNLITNQAETIYTSYYEKAIHTGLWYPKCKVGSKINEGELLGEIKDFFGNLLKQYHAQEDGILFYQWKALAIKESDPLLFYGSTKKL